MIRKLNVMNNGYHISSNNNLIFGILVWKVASKQWLVSWISEN